METIVKNKRSKSVLKSRVNGYVAQGTKNPLGETYSAYAISKPSEISHLLTQIRQPAARLGKDFEDLTVLVVTRDREKRGVKVNAKARG